jgi:hypothetical protein
MVDATTMSAEPASIISEVSWMGKSGIIYGDCTFSFFSERRALEVRAIR